jgi:imidazoleglycerol-phosphate dehydratase
VCLWYNSGLPEEERLPARRAEVHRTTNETDIALTLDLDGSGVAEVATGIGFFDHMLELFAHHSRFDLRLKASGDLDVDGHHTVEDIGLALGQALRDALGDKRGIRRYGSCLLPMDEALAMVALDLSGRPFFAHDLQLAGVRVGSFEAELAPHFFRSLTTQAGMTLHVRLLAGSDTHHVVEAVFKGVARALAEACARHGRDDEVPSTKGTL